MPVRHVRQLVADRRILSAAVGVLMVTGIALFFFYRPTTRQAWPGILTESYDWDVRVSSPLRLPITTLAAFFTGLLLPWDQLAL